jgi:hypothetical protein
MRKFLLILILVLNTTALVVSIYFCGSYFFSKNKSVNESKPQQLTIVREKIDIEDNKDEPAIINISSIPQDAKVFVNGYYKGKTPVEFKVVDLVDTGNYRLVIIKQDYLRWEREIELNSGVLKEYNIVLEKE